MNDGARIDIGGRRVGASAPCFVIAEIGVNHNGELEQGRRMIDAAAAAGADAVKFQTFDADRLVTHRVCVYPCPRVCPCPCVSRCRIPRRCIH